MNIRCGQPGAHVLYLLIICAAWVWGNGVCTAQRADEEARDAALRILQRAVDPHGQAGRLPLLFALRQLRDPDLRPLFEHVRSQADPQAQIHAILALAELSPENALAASHVAAAAKDSQESIIANAIDLKLMPEHSIRACLKLDDLDAQARFLLLAELHAQHAEVDTAEFARLTGSADTRLAGLSAMVVGELGDPTPAVAFERTWASMSSADKNTHAPFLLEGVRQYSLKSAKQWVLSVVNDPASDGESIYRGLFTLATLDAREGVNRLNQWLGPQPTYARRVRAALLLLACRERVPASAYAVLDDSDAFLHAMALAGTAISEKQDPSGPLIQLLQHENPRVTQWILSLLPDLPAEASSPVYEYLLDDVDPGRDAQAVRSEADRVTLAVTAAAKLFQTRPQSVAARLGSAAHDSRMQQCILLGLLENRSADVADLASTISREKPSRSACLACLLIAKHRATISEHDRATLGTMAAGGGLVSEVLQVQSAWLYLKHTSQVDLLIGSMRQSPAASSAH